MLWRLIVYQRHAHPLSIFYLARVLLPRQIVSQKKSALENTAARELLPEHNYLHQRLLLF